jgi:GMP synthase (glutamine-hydrolysing)
MSAARPILVLQHAGCEPPGAYEDELLARQLPFARVLLDEGEELPDWRAYSAIVAMGGGMSVNDEAEHSWLAPEKRLIGEAVRAGTPYWGVCLGAQLLAASLGAHVAPGATPEVGVLPVYRTAEAKRDPVFASMPDRILALQWHADTFALPDGAVRLARSDAYEQQAFVVNRAYGVQFHIEIGTRLAAEWGEVPAYAESLEALMGEGAMPRLLDQVAAAQDEMTSLARTLFGAWLERVVGVPARNAPAGAPA